MSQTSEQHMLHPAAQQALDPMQRAAARAILSHPAQPTAVPHAAEPPAVNLPSPEAAEGELPAHSKALDSLDDAMPLNFLGNGSLSLTNSLSNLGSMPESLSDLPMPRINSQGYIGNALPVTGTADDLHAHVMTREQHRISNPLSGGGKRLMPTSVDMQALLDLDFGTDGCDAPSSPDAPRQPQALHMPMSWPRRPSSGELQEIPHTVLAEDSGDQPLPRTCSAAAHPSPDDSHDQPAVTVLKSGGDAAAQSPWLPDGLQPEDNDLSFLSLLV